MTRKRMPWLSGSFGSRCVFLLFLLPRFASAASPAIFQQEVNTLLHVTLDDRNHFLSGTEEMEYVNHSPDTLLLLYFHLWPNAYRDNTTALAKQFLDQGNNNFLKSKIDDRGYIDSLHFRIDGKEAVFSLLADTPDVGFLNLNAPLLPGQRIVITTPFRVKIPSASISRLGHHLQAYYITQWFPKPAVYDAHGWNYFPYLNEGEFYSEWGSYEVYITLPSNYVVGATGVLKDSSEVKWMSERAKDTLWMSTPSGDLSIPPSSSASKTIHFSAENVHDFAWFADKRYHVAKSEVLLPSGKKVDTWALFTNNQPDYWKHALNYVNASVSNFSKWFGEYAWPQVTAVDGMAAEGRDMEYPMVTILGESQDLFTYEITVAHEVGHFWFYGLLGSNERRVAWMDEGLANYSETRYVKNKYPPADTIQDNQLGYLGVFDLFYRSMKFNHRQAQSFLYRSGASLNNDQPPDLPAGDYSQFSYLTGVYYKPSVGFDYLQTMMGDTLFNRCMHRYYDEWKFRHPQPADMQRSFEAESGQDLFWFFNQWLSTNQKADYKICRVKPLEKDAYSIRLKNNAGVNAPIVLSGMKEGKELAKQEVRGFDGDTTVSVSCAGCDAFRLDAAEQWPEVNRQNNSIRTKGIFKKWERLRFRFLGDVETTGRTDIYYTPVVGGNNYDGFLTGAAFYNLSLVEKPIEYLVMPIYGWESKQLAGGGRVMFNFHPGSGLFSRISLGPGFSHYSFDKGIPAVEGQDKSAPLAFSKIDFSVFLDFRQKNQRESVREFLTLRNIYTATDRIQYDSYIHGYSHVTTDHRYFVFLNYEKEKAKVFHPSALILSAGLNKHFYRLSMEYNKTFSYANRGRGFDFRFFAGKVGKAFHGEDDVYLDHRLHMSGIKGTDDYLYDGTFIDRSEPDSKQFMYGEGGIAAPTNNGQGNWLAAVNLRTIIHPVLPIKLYFSFGTFENAGESLATDNKIMYELGLQLDIFPDVIAVYFPLTYSAEIKEEFKTNDTNFGDRVRVQFNLNKLNPFYSIKDKMRYGGY